MPAKEKYGAQPPIELLRQWIDHHHHWYGMKDTSRLCVTDVLFMSAMGPPSGGKNDITGMVKMNCGNAFKVVQVIILSSILHSLSLHFMDDSNSSFNFNGPNDMHLSRDNQ